MTDNPISFDDGAAYERMMGVWSRLVGDQFLDWLAPLPGRRWIDVGCGNGAFTELLVDRCAPSRILGVDPSAAQLRFARERHAAGLAEFAQGEADVLPCPADSFDCAVMALVIFFAPDPPSAVREMVRAVAPGGTISAYAWDLLEPEGFPMSALWDELRAIEVKPMLPPSAEASRIAALKSLWTGAGLIDVRTREITVARTFDSFDDFWGTVEIALGMAPATRQLDSGVVANVKCRLSDRLPAEASGKLIYTSRANAVTGRKPG